MKVVISSGHGKYVRGASGYLDEVDEARAVVDRVAQLLEKQGVGVKVYHDNSSTSQSQNLNSICAYHNAQSRDLDVSVHFNAYNTTSSPMGTECLYVTQENLADRVSEACAVALGLPDRGPKYRSDLAFLNGTNKPSILLETCFVDSKADENAYHDNFESLCVALASAISGEEIDDIPPDPEIPPVETPMTGIVFGLKAGDTLNIRAAPNSSAPIIGEADNDDTLMVVHQEAGWCKCSFGEQCGRGVSVFGWASDSYVLLDNQPPNSEWHEDITATMFGFEGDEQESAYGGWIDEDTIGVSFPYKWRDTPRPSKVIIEANGRSTTCGIVDVGPWNTDDPEYVLGEARPLSEEQYENHTKAQNGMVPSNDAGIDLTKPVADALGISGKGTVRWRFG